MRLIAVLLMFVLCYAAAEALVEVTNTRSPVRTRTGCPVVLTCGGNGTRIEWRLFLDSDALQTDENQIVNTTTFPFEGLSHSYLISTVTFTATPAVHNERYSCYIFTTEGRAVTHTVTIRVNTAAVAIEPAINNVDISSYHEGSRVTIGCPVQTCARDIQVQFLRGDTEVGRTERERVEGESDVYNIVLDVSEDILGSYVCKVDTTDPDDTAMQLFNVTGTPLPPTMPPSVATDGPNTPTTTSSTSSPSTSDNGDDSDSSLPEAARIPLLLSLLILAVIHSL